MNRKAAISRARTLLSKRKQPTQVTEYPTIYVRADMHGPLPNRKSGTMILRLQKGESAWE